MSASKCAPPALAAPPAASAPRKRRRRAPTTGAADDCFACRKKNMKCDRRRPYCTQCIDQGKECSGYKTQLTWGVGVASRGKLRGLSVPVIQKDSVVAASVSRTRTSFSNHAEKREATKSASPEKEEVLLRSSSNTPSAMDANNPFDFSNADLTDTSSTQGMWQWPIDDASMQLESNDKSSYLPQFFEQMQYLGSMEDMSNYASSTSGYSDSDYASPMDYPQSPDDISFMSASIPLFDYSSLPSPFSPYDAGMGGSLHSDGRGPTSCPSEYMPRGSMSSGSEQSSYDYMEINAARLQPSTTSYSVSQPFFDEDIQNLWYGYTNVSGTRHVPSA